MDGMSKPALVPETSAFELCGVSKRYKEKRALQNVNLTLPRGRIAGLLGPNGSGKTTMIKIIAGLIRTYEGQVTVCGAQPGVVTKGQIAYLPDRCYFPPAMTIEEGVELFQKFYTDFSEEKCLYMLGRFELSLRSRLDEMSRGMVEKFLLCLTMSREARLFLLDEPVGGVDPAARDFVLNTILDSYDEKGTILIATHQIADIERIFDTVIFLKEGQILRCEDADTMRSGAGMTIDELFREVFRCSEN